MFVDLCWKVEIILSPIVVEKAFVDAYEVKKSVCRYFMKQEKAFVDTYEAKKSVCRYFMKQEKAFVDTYEAKKSVCRYFMKQEKVFVDAYEAISRKVFFDGQKSVCRLLKKKVFVDRLLHNT